MGFFSLQMLTACQVLLAAGALLASEAQAQTPAGPRRATVPAAPKNRVYTYVEQMPRLPGQRAGDNGALVAAIQRRVRISSFPGGEFPEESRILFTFTVTETGAVSNVRILKSLSPEVDAAVLRAVRSLPRFEPGR